MALNETFVELISQLRQLSESRAEGLDGSGATVWMTPEDWGGNPLDVPNLHTPVFDRDELNKTYEEAHSSDGAGAVGDAMAAKLQLDFIAIAERAFRARHASSVRTRLHAVARLKGHGHEAGVFGRFQTIVQDYSKHGKGS